HCKLAVAASTLLIFCTFNSPHGGPRLTPSMHFSCLYLSHTSLSGGTFTQLIRAWGQERISKQVEKKSTRERESRSQGGFADSPIDMGCIGLSDGSDWCARQQKKTTSQPTRDHRVYKILLFNEISRRAKSTCSNVVPLRERGFCVAY